MAAVTPHSAPVPGCQACPDSGDHRGIITLDFVGPDHLKGRFEIKARQMPLVCVAQLHICVDSVPQQSMGPGPLIQTWQEPGRSGFCLGIFSKDNILARWAAGGERQLWRLDV